MKFINSRDFFVSKTKQIFESNFGQNFKKKLEILDIGGGLRIDPNKNNRFDKENFNAFKKYIIDKEFGLNYRIMDVVPDFNPDIVGNIEKLPFEEGEMDSIFCLAVLEHVENPIKAVSECHRVLKNGGKALFYVPFLFNYHAEVGYYKDYWRFTKDGCEYLFSKFSKIEILAVSGRFETWGMLSGIKLIKITGRFLDYLFVKETKQVSGYFIYVEK